MPTNKYINMIELISMDVKTSEWRFDEERDIYIIISNYLPLFRPHVKWTKLINITSTGIDIMCQLMPQTQSTSALLWYLAKKLTGFTPYESNHKETSHKPQHTKSLLCTLQKSQGQERQKRLRNSLLQIQGN